MKNKNIKLVIFGTLFKDIIVTTLQNLKKDFLDLSAFDSQIKDTYGGIYNILKHKIKNEKWINR